MLRTRLLLLPLLLTASCASSHTRWSPRAEVPGLFPGTRYHLSRIGPRYGEAAGLPPTLRTTEVVLETTLDLPLSFAVDTLAAPFHLLGHLDPDTRRKRRELAELHRGKTAYEIAGEPGGGPAGWMFEGSSPGVAPDAAGNASGATADPVEWASFAGVPAAEVAREREPQPVRPGGDTWVEDLGFEVAREGFFSLTRTTGPMWLSWFEADGLGARMWNEGVTADPASNFLLATVGVPAGFAVSTATVGLSIAGDVATAPFQLLIETFLL